MLKKKVKKIMTDLVWNAVWEERKHGDNDEMDASTMGHWLKLDIVTWRVQKESSKSVRFVVDKKKKKLLADRFLPRTWERERVVMYAGEEVLIVL